MSERSYNTIDLGALLDGELTADRRAELEAQIKSNPVASARLAALRADKEMLRRIYEPVAKRPIPREWLAIANGARPKASKMSWRMVGSIAAAMLVVVLATTSYIEMRPPAAGDAVADGRPNITGPEKVVQEALDARHDVTRADKVVAVENSAEVDRYTAVLRSAVGFSAKVPDMRKAGYQLTGIKVYSRGAAQLAYRDPKNHVLTLYVRRSDGEVGFVQLPRDGLRVCVWQDNEVAMVAAGNMSTAWMQRLAVLAYAGLFT
jgi:anti-sigma factor RsiW